MPSMPELEFVDDLPEAVMQRYNVADRARSLKANPGKWARWPAVYDAGHLRRRLTEVAGDGFEVVTRRIEDRGPKVTFARYVGGDES
jgi:hypothetical protein